MGTETNKTSRFDKLSDQFDRINEKDHDSDDMFSNYDIVAPYSDGRTPKPTRWRKGSIAVTKSRREA